MVIGHDLKLLYHRDLCHHEKEGEAHEAEHLEVHPNVRALRSPNDFVQDAGHDEEDAEAKREFPPALVFKLPGLTEKRLQDGTVEDKPPEHRDGKEALHDRRLHFDEPLVVQ